MQDFNALTILKYRLDGEYLFKVFDKFDEPNEPKRLDKMVDWSLDMQEEHGLDYEQLWIKTCPIFPTR